ncbi:ABC transporter ATP-binding protein [Geodermatophilus sp. DF01-2]|uniref:ABC transporter ATP-binding protein n=1 Tax=Geodermatophilus sp. DF01-2 TaxID=2559610 RepID=UPI001FD79A67|nr:ABC transporter ATP-binding protein [Geodermatophilus sp. DF01_2]
MDELSLGVPDGRITCIIGPNGCGKSTLLRALARLLRPTAGAVLLDGRAIHRLPTKEVARHVGLLPQAPVAPQGLTVADLVARGRFPHRHLFDSWSCEDEAAVEQALTVTHTAELRDQQVDELSGGQRQRVWIAMALAQRTPVLLLDEPTTHLDIAHQLEVLELLAELNRSQQRTVVMVLHDLNEAARYGHHLVAMRAGRIVAEGPPGAVVTAETVRALFGIDSRILTDPVTGGPLLVPVARAGSSPVPAAGPPSPRESRPVADRQNPITGRG